MSYDDWKTRAPEDERGFEAVDDREYTTCDICDRRILDGAADNGRIGRLYLCPACHDEQLQALDGRLVDMAVRAERE